MRYVVLNPVRAGMVKARLGTPRISEPVMEAIKKNNAEPENPADAESHKALRLKAVETSQSVSELVNNAVREAIAEDAEDIGAFESRAGEVLTSYDEMIKKLKKDGRI